MEVRLLGPVLALHEGEEVQIRGKRERTLLAALSLHAGQAVTTHRLIDALWSDVTQPQHAANALQVTTSRLRRQLPTPELVSWHGSGYRCGVPSEDVDALRFQDLVRQASRDLGSDAALASLEAALRLWRGEPLTNTDPHGWLRAEAGRLGELRLWAEEEWASAVLAAGGGAAVVPELERLVADHPLSERLRAQLMTALYRSGRQAEALILFDKSRRILADQLGVDPSAELQDVHQAILAHDASLGEQDRGPGTLPPVPPAPTATLPGRVTSFVGRRQELVELRQLLGAHRLVTVLGPAGIGKSSLALEAARRHAADRGVPAWLVDLGSADATEVVAATLAALRIRADSAPAADMDLIDRLIGHLRGQRAVLVLDNCGRVAEAAARLAHRLIRDCPELTVLVTSREVLGVAGEVVWGAPSMRLPGVDTGVAEAALGEAPMAEIADAASSDAVALFLDRAREADARFTYDEGDLRTIEEICTRLDGLPLAIELAAAQTRALSVAEIAERVHDRFRLLEGGAPRFTVPRHRTLRAAIDWSYDLLAAPEAVLFARLSVFRSAWSAADAEAVCGDGDLPVATVVPLVLRLVDRSFVTRHPGGRFRLLGTMRSYAAERLDPDTAAHLRDRHAAHFLTLCEELRASPADRRLHARVQDAMEEVTAAMDWALSRGQHELALRFAGALGWLWATSDIAEGRRRLTQALAAADPRPSLARGYALQALAYVESPMPTTTTKRAALDSIELLESFGDASGAARSRIIAAFVETTLADDAQEAAGLIDDGEAAASDCGDEWACAFAALVRFAMHLRQGRPATALPHGQQALTRFRALDDPWGLQWTSIWLAIALRTTGDLDQARDLLVPTVASLPATSYGAAIALQELGIVLVLQGEPEEAAAAHQRALTLAVRSGVRVLEASAHAAAAFSARATGDLAAASDHYAEALTRFEQLGYDVGVAQARCGAGLTRLALGDRTSGEAELCDAHLAAEGCGAVEVEAAAVEGLALCWAAADPRLAARLLGAVAAIRDRTGIRFGAVETDERARAAAAIDAQIGPVELARAVAEGRGGDLTALLASCGARAGAERRRPAVGS